MPGSSSAGAGLRRRGRILPAPALHRHPLLQEGRIPQHRWRPPRPREPGRPHPALQRVRWQAALHWREPRPRHMRQQAPRPAGRPRPLHPLNCGCAPISRAGWYRRRRSSIPPETRASIRPRSESRNPARETTGLRRPSTAGPHQGVRNYRSDSNDRTRFSSVAFRRRNARPWHR